MAKTARQKLAERAAKGTVFEEPEVGPVAQPRTKFVDTPKPPSARDILASNISQSTGRNRMPASEYAKSWAQVRANETGKRQSSGLTSVSPEAQFRPKPVQQPAQVSYKDRLGDIVAQGTKSPHYAAMLASSDDRQVRAAKAALDAWGVNRRREDIAGARGLQLRAENRKVMGGFIGGVGKALKGAKDFLFGKPKTTSQQSLEYRKTKDQRDAEADAREKAETKAATAKKEAQAQADKQQARKDKAIAAQQKKVDTATKRLEKLEDRKIDYMAEDFAAQRKAVQAQIDRVKATRDKLQAKLDELSETEAPTEGAPQAPQGAPNAADTTEVLAPPVGEDPTANEDRDPGAPPAPDELDTFQQSGISVVADEAQSAGRWGPTLEKWEPHLTNEQLRRVIATLKSRGVPR